MLLELLLAANNCRPPHSSQAVGLWEMAPGGNSFGHAIELRGDGTFIDAMIAMVDMRYRVSAEHIAILPDSATSDESAEAVPFEVSARTLVMHRGDKMRRKVKMTRVGSPPDPTHLVQGVWRYRHQTGGVAFEKYLPDGRLLFRLPFPAKRGCFTVQASEVSLSYPEGPFVLRQTAPDVLEQEGDDDDPFQRARDGVWYALTANDGSEQR